MKARRRAVTVAGRSLQLYRFKPSGFPPSAAVVPEVVAIANLFAGEGLAFQRACAPWFADLVRAAVANEGPKFRAAQQNIGRPVLSIEADDDRPSA